MSTSGRFFSCSGLILSGPTLLTDMIACRISDVFSTIDPEILLTVPRSPVYVVQCRYTWMRCSASLLLIAILETTSRTLLQWIIYDSPMGCVQCVL
ncbi:hypothetical protein RB195_010245 [Necator americanus]|uniref:Secreted protein n=1 Tax=Necator americanus TaxID=51031 RepID=A0ABR1CYH3_NECAM